MKNLFNRLIKKDKSEKETGQKTGQAPYALPETKTPVTEFTTQAATKHLGLSEEDLNQAIQDNVNYINDFRSTLLEFCQREYKVLDGHGIMNPVGLYEFRDTLHISTEEFRSLLLKEIANIIIPNLSCFCENEYDLEIEIARTNRLTELISILPAGLQLIDPTTTNTYPNDRGMQTYDATKNTVVNSRRYNKLKAFYDKHAGRIIAEEKATAENARKASRRFQKKLIKSGVGGTAWTHDNRSELITKQLTHLFKHHGYDACVTVTREKEMISHDYILKFEVGVDEGPSGAKVRYSTVNETLCPTHADMCNAVLELFFRFAEQFKPDNPPSQRLMEYASTVVHSNVFDGRYGIYN